MSDEKLPAVVVQGDIEVVEDSEGDALLAEALQSMSVNTRTAYMHDWRRFGTWWGDRGPGEALADLIAQDVVAARRLVALYRSTLEKRGLASSTVARALRALNGIVKALNHIGVVSWTLNAKAPKTETYRDTRGPNEEQWSQLLDTVQNDLSAKGKRDLVILLLMHDSALRRAEVAGIQWPDDCEVGPEPSVWILGKGNTQKTRQPISQRTKKAIKVWLVKRGLESGPLACRVTSRKIDTERAMDGDAIYYVLKCRSKEAGFEKTVRPHGLRHAAITKAAKNWTGSLVGLQRFARHADPRVTVRYVDDVGDAARQCAEIVAAEHEEPIDEEESELQSEGNDEPRRTQ